MSVGKWLGASLGWSFGGPIGAIIGLALGSLVDGLASGKGAPLLGEWQTGQRQQQSRQRRRRQTTYRTEPQRRRQRPQTQPGDFEVSLLILASIVIKADGKQDQKELDYVRKYFVQMYGKDRANHAFKLFKNIVSQNVSTRKVSMQIKQMMDHSSRLQLLHFLFGIAKSDGIVTEDEIRQIYTISGYMGISNRDFESIKAMFYNSRENAYKILEVSKNATKEQKKNLGKYNKHTKLYKKKEGFNEQNYYILARNIGCNIFCYTSGFGRISI